MLELYGFELLGLYNQQSKNLSNEPQKIFIPLMLKILKNGAAVHKGGDNGKLVFLLS